MKQSEFCVPCLPLNAGKKETKGNARNWNGLKIKIVSKNGMPFEKSQNDTEAWKPVTRIPNKAIHRS